MDVFQLRQDVVQHYADYTTSFLVIRDAAIRAFVHQTLADGTLWPDALVQLSPAYKNDMSVAALAKNGVLHPRCANIFQHTAADGSAQSLNLYYHQRQAIELAAANHSYVVTTGTGSGKSLTYIIPIVNHILQHQPEAGKVRAIIVYPMNALINSQEQAIERFLSNLPESQRTITFARYTGQESDAEKKAIQQNPPHMLLTNYVMLELMLTRPDEFPFVDRTTAALQFVVLDELHTYRGRQGADVALLMRRLRERCGNPQLICIGTSATMASGTTAQERRTAVAEVASTIFGMSLPPDHVIEETLAHAVPFFNQPTNSALYQAILHPVRAPLDWASFQQHPLAAWIEHTFSVQPDETGALRRTTPQTLQSGAAQLAKETGAPHAACVSALTAFFQHAGAVRDARGRAAFAFKLHQFISQGGAVYATAEPPEQRHLTLEGQRYVAGPDGERLLYPLSFCRECGQHYYLCIYDPAQRMIEPRPPMSRGEEVHPPALAGYMLLGDDVWSDGDEDLLPDTWFRITKRGRTITKNFKDFVPRRVYVTPDGCASAIETAGSTSGWFIPVPFLTCLCCGAVYTKRDRDDFRKLARLSSEGRSTATTLLSVAAVDAMHHSTLAVEAQKLLSFTDNRQDASLQAGHLNDFVSVGLLRSALALAIERQPEAEPLTYLNIARTVFRALALPQAAYAKEAGATANARRRNDDALIALLEYRVYEDLRRSWRVTQPNLEQCGLLQIDYDGLDEECANEELWQTHPVLRDSSPEQRAHTLRVLLDYMRRELAVDAPVLQPEHHEELTRRINAALNERWAFDTHEIALLRRATQFVVPSDEPLPVNGRSFGGRGALGRFLRSPRAWPVLDARLDDDAYTVLLNALLDALVGATILTDVGEATARAVQIRHDVLLWRRGTDAALPIDPVRERRMAKSSSPASGRPVNTFFQQFYRNAAHTLRSLEGREHTGQVKQYDREQREQRFRSGNLPVLFCSPTMELGIDIADLNMVHLRNVPPTPANYAQRSGRAGRSGQAAFVVTYCSTGSGHDQYFFQRQSAMVAGQVVPSQLDLANEDLVRAHVHAVWLAFTQIDLSRSMLNLVDTSVSTLPLQAAVQAQLQLEPAQQAACIAACVRVLATCLPALQRTSWYGADWLAQRIAEAATRFHDTCDRWRKLYEAADMQLHTARNQIDLSHQKRMTDKEVNEAKRLHEEALRQKDVLCNNRTAGRGDTDFYPYRYFASEGFLPGYNFPRLPVRAFLRTGDEGDFVARPRFLALSEFGPQNVIYHEGRKYRVTRSLLPPGDPQQHFVRAKVCGHCGYFHEGVAADLCEQCGASLHGGAARLFTHLFPMTTVSTTRTERITCEEEERIREGYRLSTHYRFAHDQFGPRHLQAYTATPNAGDQPAALQLAYGQAATIWRINHGWRRALHEGFALNVVKGTWERGPDADEDAADGAANEWRRDVRIVVQDTRNLLVVTPDAAISADDEQIVSLQYALQRGITTVFQLEEQELNSELLGEAAGRRILLWEASEGGAGVLRRLVEEPDALARVARAALELCHVDGATGAERAEQAGECARACYRCLLSYANQPFHARLNRRSIRDVLWELAHADVQLVAPPLRTATSAPADTATPAMQRVLDYISAQAGRPPDVLLPEIGEYHPHLQYGSQTLVLCPAAGESVTTMRADLEDAGYLVLVVHADLEVGAQLERYTFWKAAS